MPGRGVRAAQDEPQGDGLPSPGPAGRDEGVRFPSAPPLPGEGGEHAFRLVETPDHQTPKVLGVDDWAKRKGQDYGTILVDLEQGRIVDILPDRTAEGLE